MFFGAGGVGEGRAGAARLPRGARGRPPPPPPTHTHRRAARTRVWQRAAAAAMTDYVIRTRRAGVSGVDSVHRLPIKQEMPPSGGYPAVRFSRSMPNAGPSGALLMAGAFTLFCYGMYRQKAATEVWWTKKQERYFNRMVTAPVLQAYEDKE